MGNNQGAKPLSVRPKGSLSSSDAHRTNTRSRTNSGVGLAARDLEGATCRESGPQGAHNWEDRPLVLPNNFPAT